MQQPKEQLNQIIRTATKDPLIGSVFDEKYEILTVLGSGGMGSVYKAKHTLLNKIVALKLLQNKLLADSTAVLRFKREAKAAGHLQHPHIIKLEDYGVTAEGQPYQVMECLSGTSLQDVLKRENTLPLDQALHIWLQICSGLAEAHEKGVIHRDLKPSNIMLIEQDNDPGFVKIVDFGIAKMLGQEGETVHQLTQTGDLFGSPFYMSPEQCQGASLDGRSDIYSMACLMFECIAGTPPFVSENVFATIQKHLELPPPSLADFVKDDRVVAVMEPILLKALAKDREKRHKSMDELAHSLIEVQAGRHNTVFGRFMGKARAIQMRLITRKSRQPIKLVLALAICVTLLVAAGAFVMREVITAKIPAMTLDNWPPLSSEAEITNPEFVQKAQIAFHRFTLMLNNLSDAKDRAHKAEVLASTMAKAGDYARAIEAYEKLGNLTPQFESKLDSRIFYNNIGDAFYYRGDYKNAIALYTKALNVFIDTQAKQQARLHLKLGECFYQTDSFAEAIREFKLAGRISEYDDFPDSMLQPEGHIQDEAIFMSEVGISLYQLRMYSKAIPALTGATTAWKTLENEPHSQEYIGACLYYLGLCEANLNHWDNAIAAFERCRELLEQVVGKDTPQISPVYHVLAEAYQRRGDYGNYIVNEWQARHAASRKLLK